MISGKNQIGKLLVNAGKDTFKTYNPKSGEENEWVFFEASPNEVDQACELANSAFVEFRNISDKNRAQFLREIANQIEDLGDELIQTYCLESGLEASRALIERSRTCYQITSLADTLDAGTWKETTFHKGTNDLRKTYIPLGPVIILFPIQDCL